jgi:hypothetical protein
LTATAQIVTVQYALVPRSPAIDPLLTVQQLAAREGLEVREVRRLIDDHALPCHKVHATERGPRGIKIRLSEYLAWLEARRVQ